MLATEFLMKRLHSAHKGCTPYGLSAASLMSWPPLCVECRPNSLQALGRMQCVATLESEKVRSAAGTNRSQSLLKFIPREKLAGTRPGFCLWRSLHLTSTHGPQIKFAVGSPRSPNSIFPALKQEQEQRVERDVDVCSADLLCLETEATGGEHRQRFLKDGFSVFLFRISFCL